MLSSAGQRDLYMKRIPLWLHLMKAILEEYLELYPIQWWTF